MDDEGKHYTEWYDVNGHLSTDFDDILVPAVSSIDRSILSSATDFDQTAYRPFQYAYLAGFVTQTYTIDFVEGSKDAEEIIKDTLTENAEKDIGGAKAKVDSLDTQLSNRTFKLLVLPFWLATFQYNNKRYQVVVNGLSGAVYGKAPVSTAKVLFVLLIFVAIIALFIWL